MNTLTHTPARTLTAARANPGDVIGGKGTGLGARMVTPEGTLAYPRTGKPAPEALADYVANGKVTVIGRATPQATRTPSAKPTARKAAARKAPAVTTERSAFETAVREAPHAQLRKAVLSLSERERTSLANALGDSLA